MPLNEMNTNHRFIQSSDIPTITAPFDIKGGEFYIIGSFFIYATTTTKAGKLAAVTTKGVYYINKKVETMGVGDQLFWDDTEKKVTTSSGVGLYPVGVCLEDVTDDNQTECTIFMNGNFTVAVAAP